MMRRLGIAVAAALLLTSLASPASAAGPATRGFLPANAHAHGHSLVDMSTAWNEWAFSTPEAVNPIVAVRCEQSLLDPKIWFLPVSMGDELEATCKVPQGAFLVLNLGGGVCGQVWGDGDTYPVLRACAESFRPSYAEATIDGRTATNLDDYWVATRMFMLPPDNLFSPAPGLTVAATYTLVMEPLSRGTHTVRAYDEIASLDFAAGITFTVNVR
jgi:hypothetical protein